MKLVKIDPVLPLKMINIFGSDEIKQRQLRVFWRFILLVTKQTLAHDRIKMLKLCHISTNASVLIVYISSTDFSKIISLKDLSKPTSVISKLDKKIIKTRNI